MLFVAATAQRLWASSSTRALSLSWRTCGRASFSTSAPRRDSVADEQEAQVTSKAAKKAQWQRNSKSTAFIDTLTLHASAGTGGDGCVSFSRAKYVPYGPPSGGNGGSGGSIYIRAVPQLRSLARVPSSVTAGDGQHGQGEWQGGKRGKDVVVEVPVGTVVRVRESGGERAWVNEAEREVGERRGEYEDELMGRLGRYRLKKRRPEGQQQQQQQVAPEEQEEEDEQNEQDYGDHIDNYDYGVSSSSRSSSSRSDYFDPQAASRLLERRALVSSVWRHHPGSTPAPDEEVASASDDDALETSEDVYSGEDFHRAEERYALLERDRRYAAQRRGSSIFETEIDLDTPSSSSAPPLLIATGGPGGQGNAFFLSGASRSPKLATRGRHGQRVEVSLELKSPADVGMVGLPNAGKSSLLQAWTGASRKGAKVGGWEFTTLHPNVGVMRLDPEGGLVGVGRGRIGESSEEGRELEEDQEEEESTSRSWTTSSERRLLVADLPGLILGASDNVGLGHSFLRHAERCAALIYVVDVSSARPTPWDDIAVLRRELEQYSPGLSKKVAAVVANKCDALGPATGESVGEEEGEGKRETVEEAKEKLARLRREVHPLLVLPVSAMWRMGVEGAAKVVYDLAKAREKAAKEPVETVEGED